MFLLIAEAAGLFELLVVPELQGSIIGTLGIQFGHSPWAGLRLWDLGQPFFMFISGTAISFSYEKRWKQGGSWRSTLFHAFKRFFLLMMFGWAVTLISPIEGDPSGAFLVDALPALAIAGFIAFLMMRRTTWTQLFFSFGLLVFTELLYRLWAVPGFDRAFEPDQNFGAYLNLLLMGRLPEGHWVAFNAVPATAFTIWGVLAGRLLQSRRLPSHKIRVLCGAGVLGIVIGFSWSLVTPIIGRICTSSFVIVSGGFSLLAFALCYRLFDMAGIRRGIVPFQVIGRNSLAVYLFLLLGGADWILRIVEPLTLGISRLIGVWPAQALAGLMVLGLIWSLCYLLFLRKVFIRI